jgi:hypothetical protein
MDNLNADSSQSRSRETEAKLHVGIAWQAQGIAEAYADVAADRLVYTARLQAWVDSLRAANPLPVPRSAR